MKIMTSKGYPYSRQHYSIPLFLTKAELQHLDKGTLLKLVSGKKKTAVPAKVIIHVYITQNCN